jgi:hypothetical protein
MSSKQIFTNQTTDGLSDTFTTNGSTRIKVEGDLNGATIELYSKAPNNNSGFSTTGSNNNIVEEGEFILEHRQLWQYKLNLINAGASTKINVFVSE